MLKPRLFTPLPGPPYNGRARPLAAWGPGATTDRGHLELVAAYLESAAFADIRGGLTNPESCPPGDPLFLVSGVKGDGG